MRCARGAAGREKFSSLTREHSRIIMQGAGTLKEFWYHNNIGPRKEPAGRGAAGRLKILVPFKNLYIIIYTCIPPGVVQGLG